MWESILSGFGGSAISNAMQWAYSEKAAQLQYENQRKLNEHAYDLTQRGHRESMSNLRIGLENAGYNPMLAVNASPNSTFSGGSASMPSVPSFDVGSAVSDAYKVYKLAKEKNKAEVGLIKAQTENVEKDTELKGFDKPLKLLGDVLNNPEVIKNKLTNFKGYVDTNAKNLIENSSIKGLLSRGFWKYGDFVNDVSSYLEDKFKGNKIPFKYYKGLSKNMRIKNGVYNYKQLLKKKGRK